MNKECLRSLVKSVDTQLFEIVNNLICSICQELFNKPVTTPCGHSFCNGCIKRVLSSKNNSGCPLCKTPVKRYGLEADEVKSKFIEICKELPFAFEQDVKELTADALDFGEDLIKSSKLSQLYNQEFIKESKVKRQRSTASKKVKKVLDSVHSENDSESFCPVLKRANNVAIYASAKKKRMDDLVSVSQTEPASSSSLGDSVEVKKKLEKIEKIPPEEKINEWLNAAGDNIFINSPGFSILETSTKSEAECEKKENDKPKMIRRDYNKTKTFSKIEADTTIPVKDPYEFVPSQNRKALRKKRQKRPAVKKIPDFKALQRFSKESVKRNTMLLEDNKEEVLDEEEGRTRSAENRITASQKFDQLLQETKEEPKKPHALYAASQSSSPKFLDVSFNSKVDPSTKVKKTPRVSRQTTIGEEILFKDVELSSEKKQGRISLRPKRRRSWGRVKSNKKQKLEAKGGDTPDSEKSTEEYLMEEQKLDFPPTKLEEILKELLDDDIIYATRPPNAPVRLPEVIIQPQNQQAGIAVTQNTELIGFCTQEECPNEKNFKKLVENMEKELNSSQYLTIPSSQNRKPEELHPSPNRKPQTAESVISPDENGNCQEKISESSSFQFLHLGRLTPVRKRAKSTVVKVFFPIGVSSLARRRLLQTSYVSPAQIARRPTHQVSTGIQTAQQQQPVSCLVQTSQVHQSSAMMQTSQEERPSVEIQTTQKCNASAGVQTSQRFVCQEIQTTQIEYGSANVQTTLSQAMNSQSLQTPARKPPPRRRKIITRKLSSDTDLFTAQNHHPVEKEVVMDFDVEEEFEKIWRETQKQDRFVELKNQMNKERNAKPVNNSRKSMDVDSDDSDIQPPKRRNSFRILSEESVGILERDDTRRLNSQNKHDVDPEDEMEVIQLDTPRSQNSEEQMLRVLKNIDLDLPKGNKSTSRGEKSEESDSDFFVEQTPPRPSSRCVEDVRNHSRSWGGLSCAQKTSPRDGGKNDNFDGVDLIGDSMPKGFSESFLSINASQKVISDKHPKEDIQKMSLKSQTTIDLPNENDQNQMNAFEDKTKLLGAEAKAAQLRAVIDEWKTSMAPARTASHKKLFIAASSVKNSDLIKKFASRFKVEYLSKPTKDMTHLIVGLHENEDKEMLPLCTPKLLFAMANKKWVVSELWAEACLKANMILPEEEYETLDPVGGNGCRTARISAEKLLRNCEIFLLGEFHMISKEDFSDLILDCGGSLVPTPERFSFSSSKLRMIIADRDCLKLNEKQLRDLYQKYSTVILSRDVIIMSIQSYKLANFSPYLLHPALEETLLKWGYPPSLVRNEEEEVEEGSAGSAR